MKKLHASRFHSADAAVNTWVVKPELGVTVEDMEASIYWANIARMLKPWDRIEAHAADGSWMAHFVVRDAGPMYAKVTLISKIDLDSLQPMPDIVPMPETSEFSPPTWRGPHSKWCILRLADKAVVKEGCASRDEAKLWLTRHVAKAAA